MEVSGPFTTRKELQYPLNRRLSVGKEKNLVPSGLWTLVCPAPTV